MKLVWLKAEVCEPPHEITRPLFRDDLVEEFKMIGWDTTQSILVGYQRENGMVQLLHGSHRWDAARRAGIKVPVIVYPHAVTSDAWGDLDLWYEMLEGQRCV